MSSGSLSWDEPKEHFLLYIDLLGISRAFLNPYTPERIVVQEVTEILFELNSWTDIFAGRKNKFSISDSMLALFPHTSEGLQECVGLARNLLLLSLGNEFKFPLRGAISHGYMAFPKQTFEEANGNSHNYSHMMGAALVRAHTWERTVTVV